MFFLFHFLFPLLTLPTSESLDPVVCNKCILLPNRGHAVQFLVMIYMDMAEVSLTLVLQKDSTWMKGASNLLSGCLLRLSGQRGTVVVL